MELRAGDRFDEFEVLEKIGAGSFSSVFLAYDTILDRHVVLKQLRPDLSEDDQEWDAFINEAQVTASFFHPGLISVHSLRVNQDKSSAIIVLEYMNGGTLRHILEKKGQINLEQVWNLSFQVGNALSYLHERGMIHRDIKPENILYSKEINWYKLTDFGLLYHPSRTEFEALNTGQPGTLRYMSPEQAQGRAIDHRSDQYTFAAVLFEALSGEYYLGLDDSQLSPGELVDHICHHPPLALPMVHQDGVLVDKLEDVLLRALTKDPEERFRNTWGFMRRFNRMIEFMTTSPDSTSPH
jgi:serine/threonine-protein kinase